MRCHKCGAASRVTYTTEQPELFRTKRRRICDNGHRFNTYEVHTQVITAAGRVKVAQLATEAARRVEKYARDLRVWLAHSVRGLSYSGTGVEFGLSKGTVQGICERMKKQRERSSTLKGER